MTSPTVSVITPTYNHAGYIATCIDSVLAQTFENWEQIIIDDGSTDETPQIVARYRDRRIRCERQRNRGPFELAHTYNRALSLARGDLIAILEGDDCWPEQKLEEMVPAFRDEGIVLAFGERTDIDAQGRKQKRKTVTARRRERLPHSILMNDPVGAATRFMLLEEGRSLVGPCTAVIRRSALEAIGGFQFVRALPLTDYPTFLELSLAGRFFYSPAVLGYFRRHERSVTVNHARTIHQAVSQYASEFMERNASRIALSPLERSAVDDSWKETEEKLHFAEGRVLLLQRDWPAAREHFRMASRSKVTRVRAAACAGFVLSFAHLSLEPLMRMSGRSDMRPVAKRNFAN